MSAERIPPGRVLTLGGLSAFGPLSLDLYLPALPQLTASLRTTESLGQASMSVCMIGLAVGQLLFGPVTDRYGRRIPLLVGVAAFAVTAGLSAVAPTIEILLVLRLCTGLAGAVGIVTARAIVRDLYDGPAVARMFSLLMLVNGAAPILAPVLGSQLMRVTDWRGLFLALAVIGVVLFVAALTQAETLPAPGGAPAAWPARGGRWRRCSRTARSSCRCSCSRWPRAACSSTSHSAATCCRTGTG